MALSNAYLMTTKNLEKMLASIRNAQAPEKFTIKFLESLGFTVLRARQADHRSVESDGFSGRGERPDATVF